MKRRGLVEINPFEDVKHAAGDASERQRFITRTMTAELLEAAPDTTWRTIIALCRYGGLRCPSEVLSLRWCGVDWEKERVRVGSPKTEHHAGRGSRVIPLFPELKPCLEEAWDAAEEGAVYVIGGDYRQAAMAKSAGIAAICERSSRGSSPGPGWRSGPVCSTTCGHPGKRNWSSSSLSTLPLPGLATRFRSPDDIVFR